jgi:hypothetical protein
VARSGTATPIPGISAAERVVAWWTGPALAVTDTDAPTPCPACGAGPDQSADPEYMLRGVCYCGHPRFFDHKHTDGTCLPRRLNMTRVVDQRVLTAANPTP